MIERTTPPGTVVYFVSLRDEVHELAVVKFDNFGRVELRNVDPEVPLAGATLFQVNDCFLSKDEAFSYAIDSVTVDRARAKTALEQIEAKLERLKSHQLN